MLASCVVFGVIANMIRQDAFLSHCAKSQNSSFYWGCFDEELAQEWFVQVKKDFWLCFLWCLACGYDCL